MLCANTRIHRYEFESINNTFSTKTRMIRTRNHAVTYNLNDLVHENVHLCYTSTANTYITRSFKI